MESSNEPRSAGLVKLHPKWTTNQPIAITHPEITRFFMTISEAVSLVLQAFASGRHGDILVLDRGEPVRVADLAKTLFASPENPARNSSSSASVPAKNSSKNSFIPMNGSCRAPVKR